MAEPAPNNSHPDQEELFGTSLRQPGRRTPDVTMSGERVTQTLLQFGTLELREVTTTREAVR